MELADVIGILGLLLLAVGLWMYWPPLALIVSGAILTGLALFLVVARALVGISGVRQ